MRTATALDWRDAPAPTEPRRTPATAVTTISRLVELTGTTPRALRHYEHEGLLAPVRGPGGQRRYRPDDVERAMVIAWLRGLGVSIPKIRDLLDGDRATEAHADLRRSLKIRILDLDASRRAAERALAALELIPPGAFDLRHLRAATSSTELPAGDRVAIGPSRD